MIRSGGERTINITTAEREAGSSSLSKSSWDKVDAAAGQGQAAGRHARM